MVKLRRVDEAKQVGTLYHICSPTALIYNLRNNCIRPGSMSNTLRGKKVISFTRNKNYIVDTIPKDTQYFFQMIIDGDTLSNKQKIEPYADTLYRDPEEREQEEIVFGPVENLKSVLKGVIAYIDTSAIALAFSHYHYSLPNGVLESYNELEKSGVPVEIRPIKGKSNLAKERTELPNDISSLIELFKRVRAYDTNSMFAAIMSLCEQFFRENADIKTRDFKLSLAVEVNFKGEVQLSSYKKEIQVLVDTIQEELDSKNVLVTQKKASDKPFGRHGETKFSTVLNNRSYKISSLLINPCFDYVNLTKPYITISLLNSSDKELTFTAQFY